MRIFHWVSQFVELGWVERYGNHMLFESHRKAEKRSQNIIVVG
jgi:hypothetical protein